MYFNTASFTIRNMGLPGVSEIATRGDAVGHRSIEGEPDVRMGQIQRGHLLGGLGGSQGARAESAAARAASIADGEATRCARSSS
jgi:hypothetical protein